MKFGVREICDVVFRAKANQKIGNKIFYKHEPVIYFDSLKTSTLEGAATTVYAQGGRGNARLVAWEGERTLTFTMEDALISPEGFSILSGAGLIDANEQDIHVHSTEIIGFEDLTVGDTIKFNLTEEPKKKYVDGEATEETDGSCIYAMILKDGDIISEPFNGPSLAVNGKEITLTLTDKMDGGLTFKDITSDSYTVLVDYYVTKTSGAQQIEITADKFGGNYYVEASTLFRDTNGVDMPAEFVIPNAKIQSNFTFSMASSGDPSTFTFTMDAFPDYTRFDKTKKVMALIQIIGDSTADKELTRESTKTTRVENSLGQIVAPDAE